jgi:hypothetical protein
MSKKFLIFGIVIILIVLALIIFLFFLKNAENREASEMAQKEQPRILSSQPLAPGKQVYSIITDKPKNPQILEVEVDPLDVEIGQNQTILVKLQDNEADSITEHDAVSATVITDNKSIVIPLKLIKAEGQEALLTFWQGLWERDDSIDYDYRLRVEAANIKGENSVEITFR